MKFYSKEGQDRWVFEVLNKKTNGYFIDIGAREGIVSNNSYFFENIGWNGICVEPHDYSFTELSKNRNCIKEHICIFDKDTVVDFVSRGRAKDLSGIICENSSIYIKKSVSKGHPIIKKQAISLLNLLEKNNCPKIIDYLSIDTEGSEFDIIKNFDFSKYTFLTITIEHNYDKNKKENIENLLKQNKYILDKTVTRDDFYIHNSVKYART